MLCEQILYHTELVAMQRTDTWPTNKC